MSRSPTGFSVQQTHTQPLAAPVLVHDNDRCRLLQACVSGELKLEMFYHRGATVEALTELTCLTLARDRFTELLGPLQDIMKRDKSPEVQSNAVCSCRATLTLLCMQAYQLLPS
jgi:hypothetical protein